MEYNSGLNNLLTDDASYWLPQSSASVREHVIEIDFGKEESISGFKITQANIATAIQCPNRLKSKCKFLLANGLLLLSKKIRCSEQVKAKRPLSIWIRIKHPKGVQRFD